MTMKKTLAAGAISTLALSLTACGGGDSSSEEFLPATSPATAPSTVTESIADSSTDGRVAQQPGSGPATRAEELATVQVSDSLEAVGIEGVFSDDEILDGGRNICGTIDLRPDYLAQAILDFHDPESTYPAAMVPPTLVREFCPAYYPSEEDLKSMFADAWGGDTWYPGQN